MSTQEQGRRSNGFTLLDFALVAFIAVCVVLAAPYIRAWWQGNVNAPPAITTAPAGQQPPIAPAVPQPAPQPAVIPTPNLYPEPPANMSAPAPAEYQAPVEAVPAGAPMSEEYQQTIKENTTDRNPCSAPRANPNTCATPGGPLPWPNGRPAQP